MEFLDKLLKFYNIEYQEYLELIREKSISDLFLYTNFRNINETIAFLKESISQNKKILIYGDYDCDGIMSTSIIFNTFKKLNYKVGYFIPTRENDGYGLNKSRIDFFKNLGYEIIICVDNGITLIEEIDYLHSLNMECVILDHHTLKEELPNTKYIIHPSLSTLKTSTSAGAVCFYFSIGMLNEIDPYLMSLGTISIISDLMELKDENRTLVILGLEAMNKFRYLPIFSLLDNKEKEITEEDLALQVTPKINAVCRLIDDNSIFNIVRLFTIDDVEKINALSKWTVLVNEKRKEMVADTLNNTNYVDSTNNVIIEEIETKEGLIGLIANNFLKKYHKPTFIVTNTNGIIKGSARSEDNFNIFECLTALNDELIAYGGHACAGGFSLNPNNFNNFKQKLVQYCNNNFSLKNKKERKTIPINVGEVNMENYKLIQSLRPFGNGFEKPLFKIEGFKTSTLTFSKDNKHILTKLSMNSNLIYFNYDSSLLNENFVNFIGYFDINIFRENISIQFKVIDYEN